MLALHKFKNSKISKFHTSNTQYNVFDWMVNDKVNTIIDEQKIQLNYLNIVDQTQKESLHLNFTIKEQNDWIKTQNDFIIGQNDLIIKQNEAIIAKLNQ